VLSVKNQRFFRSNRMLFAGVARSSLQPPGPRRKRVGPPGSCISLRRCHDQTMSQNMPAVALVLSLSRMTPVSTACKQVEVYSRRKHGRFHNETDSVSFLLSLTTHCSVRPCMQDSRPAVNEHLPAQVMSHARLQREYVQLRMEIARLGDSRKAESLKRRSQRILWVLRKRYPSHADPSLPRAA
jgi:hypothetical protein